MQAELQEILKYFGGDEQKLLHLLEWNKFIDPERKLTESGLKLLERIRSV